MAQVTAGNADETRQRAGVRRMKKSKPVIDMTPMADLGFLLISFFVITAELTEPRSMSLVMPKDNEKNANELGESYALTILLDGDKNYSYEKSWDMALKEQRIRRITINDLRNIIVQKQQALDDTSNYNEGRKGLMLLIKPTARANYETVVDVLDEAVITGVKKYAILELTAQEKNWLTQNN